MNGKLIFLLSSVFRIYSEIQITQEVCTFGAYDFVGESYLELDGYISS
jgi:hypothetical protein